MARVLLLDTHSLFFRAFYALPPMTTLAGQPTSALYGLSVVLLKLLREERPLGIAFALDSPKPTFRHEQSPSYKATRTALADPLREQLAVLPRLLEATGAPCIAAPSFEADDVLATLARELAPTPVRVVTGDRDLFQLIDARVDVLFVGARGQKPVLYDEAAIARRYQLQPAQLPSRTALVGDPSDNLPKVPGIGERGAEALIRRFGDVTQLLTRVSEVTPVKLQQVLIDHAAQIRETEDLARLRRDAPLPDGPRYAAIGGNAIAALRALFVELEFSSLLSRLERLAPAA